MSLVELDRARYPVVVVTLSDPQRRNALSLEMAASFRAVLDELGRDSGLAAVVLTGAPPVFSAGGALGMLESQKRAARRDAAEALPGILDFYRAFLSPMELPVPVIAAVNGHAVGAGLCLALACDLRVVAAEAKLGVNFVRLGLHPGMGATCLLPQAVGAQRAAAMLYGAGLVTGREMEGTGWAARTCPGGEVVGAALALADTIAANSPTALRLLKQTLSGAARAQLEDHLAREARAQVESLRAPDIDEGLAAVAERRAPAFPRPGGHSALPRPGGRRA